MNIENIDDLKTAVQSIIVKDYGDFKRKTILYLNRFTEKKNEIPQAMSREIFKLKWHIQYHPSGDIEPTRNWTLQQLDKLS